MSYWALLGSFFMESVYQGYILSLQPNLFHNVIEKKNSLCFGLQNLLPVSFKVPAWEWVFYERLYVIWQQEMMLSIKYHTVTPSAFSCFVHANFWAKNLIMATRQSIT